MNDIAIGHSIGAALRAQTEQAHAEVQTVRRVPDSIVPERQAASEVHLTQRQFEVLALLCEVLPNKLICRAQHRRRHREGAHQLHPAGAGGEEPAAGGRGGGQPRASRRGRRRNAGRDGRRHLRRPAGGSCAPSSYHGVKPASNDGLTGGTASASLVLPWNFLVVADPCYFHACMSDFIEKEH
jgi:hypothetical protein